MKNQMSDSPAVYEIRVLGVLDDKWAVWFDGVSLTHEEGVTTLTGLITDQAALHGMLVKVRDMGMLLLSVRRLNEMPASNDAKENWSSRIE